jgi:hypothetical protein
MRLTMRNDPNGIRFPQVSEIQTWSSQTEDYDKSLEHVINVPRVGDLVRLSPEGMFERPELWSPFSALVTDVAWSPKFDHVSVDLYSWAPVEEVWYFSVEEDWGLGIPALESSHLRYRVCPGRAMSPSDDPGEPRLITPRCPDCLTNLGSKGEGLRQDWWCPSCCKIPRLK